MHAERQSEGPKASLGWRGKVNHHFSLSFPTALPCSEFLLISTLLIFSFFLLDHTHVMWGLSSPTRDRTRVPCIGRQSLNHRAAGEVPPHLSSWRSLPSGQRQDGSHRGVLDTFPRHVLLQWSVCWSYILKFLWAGQRHEPLCSTCFYGKMPSELKWSYLHTNFWITPFPLVEDYHCMILCSGFYSLLIYKWTISHFFVEGAEPEVFPSERINDYIKMDFLHPTNMIVCFKCIWSAWHMLSFVRTHRWIK